MKKIRVTREEARDYSRDECADWVCDAADCLARGESVILQAAERVSVACSKCGILATHQDLEDGLCGGCQ